MTERLCENCDYAFNPETVTHQHVSYVLVDCAAPCPGYVMGATENRRIGHKSATWCEAYRAKEGA